MSTTTHDREPGKRMTLSEVVERLLQRGSAAESVTLKLNAKGETQPEVTAVVGDGETLAQAADRAKAVYADLIASYPVQP